MSDMKPVTDQEKCYPMLSVVYRLYVEGEVNFMKTMGVVPYLGAFGISPSSPMVALFNGIPSGQDPSADQIKEMGGFIESELSDKPIYW